MAKLGKSGKQKFLFVISVITIIFAVIALISGILIATGSGIVAAQGGVTSGDTTITADEAGTAMLAGIVVIFSGILTLLAGIFGIRGSKNANKIMPFIVLAIITTVFSIISVITNFTWSDLVGLVIDVLLVVLGFSIKGDPNSQRF